MDAPRAVDLEAVLSTFDEPWSPRTIGTVNDYDVRVVRTHGEFTRHSHPETDEFFLVLSGELTIRLEAGDVKHSAPDRCTSFRRASSISRSRPRVRPSSCSSPARP